MTYALHFPTTVDEALDLLARFGQDAVVMAGGTSLVLRLSSGSLRPGHVVSLRRVTALRGVERRSDGALELRALATHRAIESSAAVRGHCAALAEAFASVATIRIREQATVGGNLVHPDPAHDPPPMLVALGAEVEIASRTGARQVSVEALRDGGSVVRSDEILTRVVVPPLAHGARAAFVKFLPDTRFGYGTLSLGSLVERDDEGRCVSARIAIGGCGESVVRAVNAERALIGRHLGSDAIRDAARLAASALSPLDDVRGTATYKTAMARVWTERVLARIAA